MSWDRIERLMKEGILKSEDLAKMYKDFVHQENMDNLGTVFFFAVVGLTIAYIAKVSR